MLPAFLTTICFSISMICGNRSARLIGGSEANFWRLTCATLFLAIWAYTFGKGLSGASFPVFLTSGIIGIGVGDVALFQALPRLGSRLTMMLIQCLTAPFAAAIEWLWLGTKLTPWEIVCGAVILAGIGISLAPDKQLDVKKEELLPGLLWSLLAALGNAFGAVLSRKAYFVANANHLHIDGGTAAFQRIIGGLFLGGIALLIVKWRSIAGHIKLRSVRPVVGSKDKWKKAGPWILANSFFGQTLGVSCYQWAFQTTSTGIVLPIVATTPLVAIPFALYMEKERPSLHSIIGDVIAVAGVVGLLVLK